ncbi:MAG: hypothetical protein RLZZ432_630 [Chloroflexota bacterium]|jgi:putative Holliday junction resolvase
MSAPARVLAVDLGDRRIGLASTGDRGEVRGLPTLARAAGPSLDAIRLATIVREQRIATLAVGLPLHSDGAWSAQADRTRAWALAVAGELGLALAFVDERYSSERAAERLGPAKRGRSGGAPGPARREARRAAIDRAAAMLILEDYASGRLVLSPADAERLAASGSRA